MARKRPGDDAVGDRPDDEAFEDASAAVAVPDDEEPLDDDGEPVGRGGTALRERKAGSPKAKKQTRRFNLFGRLGNFFREVVSELRKVIWPTRRELLTYTAVVIVFVAIMTTIVGFLDLGFAKLVLWAFGNK